MMVLVLFFIFAAQPHFLFLRNAKIGDRIGRLSRFLQTSQD
jgi:hypothetical protein